METQNTMTEYLPQTRCTPEMKAALELIAKNSVARNISDHIRFAVERYVDSTMAEWASAPEPEAEPA